ncbi:MAG: regulatory iron-sulfur-containing complex subunit RicT [Faecousia sp.]
MEEEILQNPESAVEVVDIQFRPGQKVYFFDPDGATYVAGDHVIIDTARGAEYGICTAGNHIIPQKDVVAPLRCVIRLATAQDEKTIAENRAREKKAYDICMQKIADHQLDMQLVSAEVAFDGSKILFYFTADERVDFRELVKNLASVFHTRIELRQIGVRDKAKMVGGLGICGRPFCCASFLDDFQPVSIKMAKTQNLSLNPTKISGTCGRLMCCLKYEQDAYEDLIRTSPKMDSFVDTPEGRGTVVEVDLLRQRVKVRMEDAPETISLFPNADIAVLRNGKAKKNDPPIPADLAPISGGGKRVRQEAAEEKLLLEPIRFKYSTEQIVEEPKAEPEQAPPAGEEEPQAAKASRSRRRRGKAEPGKAEQTNPEAQSRQTESAPREKRENRPPREPKAPKESREPRDVPESKENAGEQGKKPGRRPNHRRHRKPKPQNNG